MKNKDWLKAARKDLEKNVKGYQKSGTKEALKTLGWIGAIGFALGRLVRHAQSTGFYAGTEATSSTVRDAIDKQLKDKEEEVTE